MVSHIWPRNGRGTTQPQSNTTVSAHASPATNSSAPDIRIMYAQAGATAVSGKLYPTIQQAINAIIEKGTKHVLQIMPGSYTENVTINNTNIVVVRGSGSNTFIEGDVTVTTPIGHLYDFYIYGGTLTLNCPLGGFDLYIRHVQVVNENTKVCLVNDTTGGGNLGIHIHDSVFLRNTFSNSDDPVIIHRGTTMKIFSSDIIALNETNPWLEYSSTVNGNFYADTCQIFGKFLNTTDNNLSSSLVRLSSVKWTVNQHPFVENQVTGKIFIEILQSTLLSNITGGGTYVKNDNPATGSVIVWNGSSITNNPSEWDQTGDKTNSIKLLELSGLPPFALNFSGEATLTALMQTIDINTFPRSVAIFAIIAPTTPLGAGDTMTFVFRKNGSPITPPGSPYTFVAGETHKLITLGTTFPNEGEFFAGPSDTLDAQLTATTGTPLSGSPVFSLSVQVVQL